MKIKLLNEKKIIIVMFFLSGIAMLLPWVDVEGIKKLNGMLVISSNGLIPLLIIIIFLISVWEFEKSKILSFIVGIISLISMFSLEIKQFLKFIKKFGFEYIEYGLYTGLFLMLLTILVYIILTTKHLHTT